MTTTAKRKVRKTGAVAKPHLRKGPPSVLSGREREGGGAKNERKNESDKQLYLGSVDGKLRRYLDLNLLSFAIVHLS
jgi:hypothetical protein